MCEECDRRAAATGTMTAAIAPGVSTVTLACVMDNYRPCQDSPYAKLPAPLLKTLADTFVDLHAGTKDSEGRRLTDSGEWIWNGACGGGANTWDALNNCDNAGINLFRIVYDRVVAAVPNAWEHILWIRKLWISTSMGYCVTYKDPVAAKRAFHDATKSAATPRIGYESRDLSVLFHPGNDCWRELPANPDWRGTTDFPGFHLLVADRTENFLEQQLFKHVPKSTFLKGDPKNGDQIHIDPIDPYKARHSDGSCEIPSHWDWSATPLLRNRLNPLGFNPVLDDDVIRHLQQVAGPGIPIISPFKTLASIKTDLMPYVNESGSEADKSAMREIQESYNREGLSQAVRGQAGWDYFQSMVDHALNMVANLAPGKKKSS